MTVLGVPRGASAAAIKSAYRKLAKKHHPDDNKNDPKAAERFAEVNSANEILGDEDRRKQFDRGEIDADGKPRFRVSRGRLSEVALGGARPGGGFEQYASDGGAVAPGVDGGGFEDIHQQHVRGGAGRGRPGGGTSSSSPCGIAPDLDIKSRCQ